MVQAQERFLQPTIWRTAKIVAGVFLLTAAARCGSAGPKQPPSAETVLRVGVGPIELTSFVQNLTVEELIKSSQEGRLNPGLAERWTVSNDGLSINVDLRARIHFHDGSLLTAPMVVDTLKHTLPSFLGTAYEDVSSITATSDTRIEFKLVRPSAFLLESLESQVAKPGAADIGTGPFMKVPSSAQAEMQANPGYYLGRPAIDRIVVQTYPSVRTAWAEMLRNHLDMVYEVGVDARDALESATSINVFSYTRHYQYMVLLNTLAPPLRSSAVRRALNAAIDRAALVREALNGHGAASSGPMWPRHWALRPGMGGFGFDPQHAAANLTDAHIPPSRDGRARLSFKCLVAANDERLALVIKQQLEGIGVDMVIEEAPIERFQPALAAHDFEGMLVDVISGPSIFRSYIWWHSGGSRNRGVYSDRIVDDALDAIRHSKSDDEYGAGVTRFQQAILDDPPAIFLAWDERARAVSRRFEVRGAEPDVDILGTLRMWRPAVGPNSN